MSEPQLAADAIMALAPKLDAAGLKWMLVGSVAGLMYGHTRATNDIDIVFDPRGVNPTLVVACLGPEYFLDRAMLEDSLKSGLMANALGVQGGPKIDMVPLPSTPFDQEAFRRRERLDWHGVRVPVISARDLVISKLRWAKDSMSARQLADVRAIMSLRDVDESDPEFQRWVQILGLQPGLDASRASGYET